MSTITITEVLDDLRAADQILRKFERLYLVSSDVFYHLYSQGSLDDGEHGEDFAEWAGFFKIKQDRERHLRQFSKQRVANLRTMSQDSFVYLSPAPPALIAAM